MKLRVNNHNTLKLLKVISVIVMLCAVATPVIFTLSKTQIANSPSNKESALLLVSSTNDTRYINTTISLLQSIDEPYDIINVTTTRISLTTIVDVELNRAKYATVIVVGDAVQWYLGNNEIDLINEATRVYGVGQLWIGTWHDYILQNFGITSVNETFVNASVVQVSGLYPKLDGNWRIDILARKMLLQPNFQPVRKVYCEAIIDGKTSMPLLTFRRLGEGNAILVNWDITNAQQSNVLWDLFYLSFKLSLQDKSQIVSPPPSFLNVTVTSELAGQPSTFIADWSSDAALSGFIFGTNNTGTWTNETWLSFPNGTRSNEIINLTSLEAALVQYEFWCNDTNGYWRSTGIQNLTTKVANGYYWFEGWGYRQQLTINKTSGLGKDNQFGIMIINGTGKSTGFAMYVDNLSRPDFADIRFAASDGRTPLNYTISNLNLGANATFWFKDCDDLTVGNSTVYVYYDKPSASLMSNDNGTFIQVIPNLALALPMDNIIDQKVIDYSANHNNDTVNGATIVQSGSAKVMQFNGASDSVIVQNSDHLNFGMAADFSIFCMLKTTGNAGAWQYFMSKDYGTPGYWEFWLNGANSLRFSSSDGSQTILGKANIGDGNWHMIGIVSNRTGTAQIYVDGKPDGPAKAMTGGDLSSNQPLTIGSTNAANNSSKYWFAGSIGNIFIINYALDPQIIASLANNYVDLTLHPGYAMIHTPVDPSAISTTWVSQEQYSIKP